MPGMLQDALLYIGSFVLVLSLVVFVHEFGHFRVGRWCGVAVKSFSIGLGSEWFGWTDKHGTRWKVSRIPLGGFVSWVDDTDGSSTLPAREEDQALSTEEARKRGHFRAMPIWKRAATVAAGPLSNFVFSILAFGLAALIVGRDITDYTSIPARVGGVEASSPAATAGLRPGDVVRAVNGAPIATWGELQSVIASSPNTQLALIVQSGGDQRSLNVTPRLVERPTAEGGTERVGAIGVRLGVLESDRTIEPVSPLAAIAHGASNTWEIVTRTGAYVGGIFTGANSGRDIAGPLGILNASGQVATMALDSDDGGPLDKVGTLLLALLQWAAMLSVAVGIVNLLPIPVLDGGHLLFYAIEAIRGGRPLPASAQEWAYRAGFAVIGSLFLFATWNDIVRLFPGAQ
jgi:regulator of sigma E protease